MSKLTQESWEGIDDLSEGILATRNYNYKELTSFGTNKVYRMYSVGSGQIF